MTFSYHLKNFFLLILILFTGNYFFPQGIQYENLTTLILVSLVFVIMDYLAIMFVGVTFIVSEGFFNFMNFTYTFLGAIGLLYALNLILRDFNIVGILTYASLFIALILIRLKINFKQLSE